MNDENMTIGEFIQRCATKKDSKRRSAYKAIAKLFAKSTHWVNAEEISNRGSVRTFVVELDDVGFAVARDAIYTINPSELCVKSIAARHVDEENVMCYNIAPLADNKLEIRFSIHKTKMGSGTADFLATDFLFEQLIANLCELANVELAKLFEGDNYDHQ